jgi:hypothetical protein
MSQDEPKFLALAEKRLDENGLAAVLKQQAEK